MPSRHLLDPQLIAAFEAAPDFTLSDALLPVLRSANGEGFGMPLPEGIEVDVREQRIAVAAGHEIGLRIYTPRAAAGSRPAVLHIHGGGYVLGSAASMGDVPNRLLAVAADCVIVSVDYRLAPETPHPGPLEDCYAGLLWLHQNATALGVDRARIAVKGESAGGGLAAALALLARDRGAVTLLHQHLIYPMIDDRTCTRADPHPYTGQFLWNAASNHFGWSSLLGSAPGAEGVPAYAAAARAGDLRGLPPAYISVGALDLFLEENMEYARRLTRAGVPTELHVYPGAPHGFEMAADSALARASARDSLQALRRAFYPAPDAG